MDGAGEQGSVEVGEDPIIAVTIPIEEVLVTREDLQDCLGELFKNNLA